MTPAITRSKTRLSPNHKKVIPRFLNTGNDRSLMIIQHVMELTDAETSMLLANIFTEFATRYKNIQAVFLKHFDKLNYLLTPEQMELPQEKKLLIGSYFTMEYSIEAAALFNPSIVEDMDQTGVAEGYKKVIVSLRATGESHISSIVFRSGILDQEGEITFDSPGCFNREGIITQRNRDNKADFSNELLQMALPDEISNSILSQLNDNFTYKEMEVVLKSALQPVASPVDNKRLRHDILSMISTSYELHFGNDSLLSERVIFPVTKTEKNGIEDARFVRFTNDDGSITYIGTYTAYDGIVIHPHLIVTKDFLHLKIAPLHGKSAINKNLALFPRKIKGQYAMISRIDGFNNYIMFSDDLYTWEEAIILQKPKYPWEFIQVGNAGSPIETEKGWLVITHGVGAMRKYCLGASLFDLENPTIELGRLKEPLLMPNEEERDGYVPNVVYSCGSMIHGDKLVIPYAVSDYASSFATVVLKDLLDEILRSH